MSYRVTLPNGDFVDVDDSVSHEESRAQIMQAFPEQFPKAGGFVNNAKAGAAAGLGSLLRAGSEALDGFEGDSGAADWLKKKSKDAHNYANSTFVATPESAEGFGNMFNRNIAEPIGGMVGAFAPTMLAAAGATALAGPVAGAATFMLPRIGTNYGQNVEYNEAKGIENDVGGNLASAVGMSILERFGVGRIVNGPMGAVGLRTAQRVASTELAPLVQAGKLSVEEATAQLPSLLKNAGVHIVENAGSNAVMMGGISALQRAQAGESLTDGEAMTRYGHDLKMAATLAPVFGPLHAGRRGAKGELEKGAEGFRKNFAGPDEGYKEPYRQKMADESAQREAEYAPYLDEVEAARAASEGSVAMPPTRAERMAAFNAEQLALSEKAARGVVGDHTPFEANSQWTRAEDAKAAFSEATPDLIGQYRPGEKTLPAPTENLEPIIDPQNPKTGKVVGYKPAETPRPDFALEPSNKQVQGEMFSTVPEQGLVSRTAGNGLLDFAKITKADDFKGVVAPQTRAKLAGLNESKSADVQKIIDTLRAYKNIIKRKDGNTEEWMLRNQTVDERINFYEQRLNDITRNETQLEMLSTAVRGEGRELFDATDGSGTTKADPYPRAASEGAPRGTGRELFTAAPEALAKTLTPEGKNEQRPEANVQAAGVGVGERDIRPTAAPERTTPNTLTDIASTGPAGDNLRATEKRNNALTPNTIAGLAEATVDANGPRRAEGKAAPVEPFIAASEADRLLKQAGIKNEKALEDGMAASAVTRDGEEVFSRAKLEAHIEAQKPTTNAFTTRTLGEDFIAAAKERARENEKDDPRQYAEAKPAEGQLHPEVAVAVGSKKGLNHTLDAIIATEQDPFLREVAKALRALGLETKLSAEHLGENKPGSFHEGADRIAINPAYADTRTILHEGVHAATAWAISNPAKLNNHQRAAIQNLKQIFAQLKQENPELAKKYGFKNLHEFVAEAFTNKEFQDALKQERGIKAERGAFTKMWDSFVQTISKLLGVKEGTALHEVLDAGTQLFDRRRGEHEVQVHYAEARPATVGEVERVGATPERARGVIGVTADFVKGIAHDAASAFDGVPQAQMRSALGKWLSDKIYNIEQRLGDRQVGRTRYMPTSGYVTDAAGTKWNAAAWEIKDGKAAPSARSLVQAQEYGVGVAEAALAYGKVALSKEGIFTAQNDANNLHALNDAAWTVKIEGVTNPLRLVNSILTQFSQMEHEQNRSKIRDAAQRFIDEGKADIERSKLLEGEALFAVRTQGKRSVAKGEQMLEDSPEYTRPAGMTDATLEKAKEMVASSPELQKVLEINRGMNMNTIQLLQEGGVISKETADLWRENQYYSPMFRVREDKALNEAFMRSTGNTAMKKFKGSEREVDVMSNHVTQLVWAADAAVRNQAQKASVDFFMRDPKMAEEIGMQRVHSAQGDKTISVRVNGEQQFYHVEDINAYKSFADVRAVLPGFMKPFEIATHMFREAIMLSPGAQIRNITRDPMEAWAAGHTTRGLVGSYGESAKILAKIFPDMKTTNISALGKISEAGVFKHGITGVRELTKQSRELDEVLRRVRQEEGIASGVDIPLDKMDGLLGRLHHKMQDITRAVEVAPREAVYQNTLKRTGSEHEARMAAINTIDFRRQGDFTGITYARALIPFFNSQIQGLYKIHRTLARGDSMGMSVADARVAMATKMLMMAGAATMYHTVMSATDDEYKNTPMDVKANNFVIPTPLGQVKAALPFEFGALAYSLPLQILETASGRQNMGEFAEGLKSLTMKQMPSMSVAFAKPMVEARTNYDFFTGRNIESKAQQGVAPEQRVNKDTSKVAQGVGKAMGWSPVQIDHAFNGYFGSIGKHVVGIVDSIIGAGDGSADTPWRRTQAGKVFFTDPERTKQTDQLYNLHKQLDESLNTLNLFKKDLRGKEYQDYGSRESSVPGITNFQASAYAKPVAEAIKNISKIRQNESIVRHGSLSGAEKQAELARLAAQRNNIAMQLAEPLRAHLNLESQ